MTLRHFDQQIARYLPVAKNALKAADGHLVTAIRRLPTAEAATALFHQFVTPAAKRSSTFFDFVADEQIQLLSRSVFLPTAHSVSGPGAMGEVLTQLTMLWITTRFVVDGQKVYRPSPGVCQRLLATELRGLDCDDIRLPFPTIYIELPEDIGLTVSNRETGSHALAGIYCHETEAEPGTRAWMIMAYGLPKTHGLDDALSRFIVRLPSGTSPQTAIDTLVAETMAKDKAWAEEMKICDQEAIGREFKALFTWLMTLVFYVTRPDAELETVEENKELAALDRRLVKAAGAKAKRLKERRRALKSDPVIVVGRRVAVDPSMPRTRKELVAMARVRTLVAGHWQRYHTRQGVTWKFRDPFWRGQGPDNNPIREVV